MFIYVNWKSLAQIFISMSGNFNWIRKCCSTLKIAYSVGLSYYSKYIQHCFRIKGEILLQYLYTIYIKSTLFVCFFFFFCVKLEGGSALYIHMVIIIKWNQNSFHNLRLYKGVEKHKHKHKFEVRKFTWKLLCAVIFCGNWFNK